MLFKMVGSVCVTPVQLFMWIETVWNLESIFAESDLAAPPSLRFLSTTPASILMNSTDG